MSPHEALQVAACVSFALSAANLPVPHINLVGLGLFFWSMTWFVR